MAFRRKLAFLLSAMVYFIAFAFYSLAQAQDVVLLTTDERIPVHYVTKDGYFSGNAFKVVSCAMRAIKQKFRLDVLPLKRAQLSVKTGVNHGFFAVSRNNERDQFATLSAVIAEQQWNWYFRKDKISDPYAEDFPKMKTVASWLGSNSQKWLEDNSYFPQDPSDPESLIRSVYKGRLDAAFGSNLIFDNILEEQNLQTEFDKVKGFQMPMGVYFSNEFISQYPKFLPRFNQAVGTCVQ